MRLLVNQELARRNERGAIQRFAPLFSLSTSVLEELPKLVHRSVQGKLGMLGAALEAPLADIPR